MTLLALVSAKASPGVTTTAVAVAAHWPGPVLLAECDPYGGDLAIRFRLGSAGLSTLAAATRGNRMTVEDLTAAAVRLPGGLPVLASPVGAVGATAALREVAAGIGAVATTPPRDPDGGPTAVSRVPVVIADCGRWEPGTPADPLLAAADLVLLLTRPDLGDLTHAAGVAPLLAAGSRPVGLVVVGDGGYGSREIAEAVGVPLVGRLPVDRTGADVACGRPVRRRSLTGTPLGRASRILAATLARDLTVAGDELAAGVAAGR